MNLGGAPSTSSEGRAFESISTHFEDSGRATHFACGIAAPRSRKQIGLIASHAHVAELHFEVFRLKAEQAFFEFAGLR